MCVCVWVCGYVCVSICLSVYLSVCICVYLCVRAFRVSVFVCSAWNIHMLDVCTLISVLGIHHYHVNAEE